MADLNPDISNGSCFSYSGAEADSRYIPCGNAVLSHKTCCESQDMCLSSNACYNGQYGVTYLAGCTDSTYSDSACPKKIGLTDDLSSSGWTGLVYCNGTSNEWVACDESGTGSQTVTKPLPCWCPDEPRTIAFSDSSTLANIMSLPAFVGQSVTWKDQDAYNSEHSLTSAFSMASSSSRSSGSGSGSSSKGSGSTVLLPPATAGGALSSTPTISPLSSITTFAVPAATSSPPPSISPGMSTGAKAGIAVGSVVGVGVLAAVAYLIYACIRRRSQKNLAKAEAPPPMREPTLPRVEHQPTDPEIRSPAWSGHKSELPADESVTSASPAPVYHEFNQQRASSVSEVEGNTPKMSPVRPTQDGGLRLPGQKAMFYEMAG